MVVLHVMRASSSSSSSPPAEVGEEEAGEFLHECAASSPVEDVAAALAGVAALQAHLLSLCRCLRVVEGRTAAGELERAVAEAESYASKEQVRHNKFLSPRALREHIKNIEKAAVAALQESPEALLLQQKSSDDKHGNVQLWWAGKELAIGKKLSDYIGVNDKTKIVIRLRHISQPS
ncbi:cilia- and flagella-associated protein 298-like [Oryza brachyantha]|uniref:cilia- and flagella-associated protein 298-like n=1 Tax=Oryza brachyantha TaxID=4533 RepID=UPI000776ABEA|nr:cilia- and flagella-associated protein 298-like [Oryza brachyantha]XP_015692960.1 cilia- and flagella-associated protein 298-like [Oryza brachyantha]